MKIAYETTRLYAPLGIRFWDAATDSQVHDGLAVRAWPADSPELVAEAFLTRSDIYAFRDLPGLADPAEHPGDPPRRRAFVVEVRDPLDRYVPTARLIELPLAGRGIYPAADSQDSAEAPPAGFYLFSASTRSVPAGLAVIRGELAAADSGNAAASAGVLIRTGSTTWHGVCDAGGRLAVLAPYPPAPDPADSSPALLAPVNSQQWPLEVRVRYSPASAAPLPGASVPDTRDIFAQGDGRLFARREDLSPPSPRAVLSATLAYGQECILRTEGTSTLRIAPHGMFP